MAYRRRSRRRMSRRRVSRRIRRSPRFGRIGNRF